MAYCVFTNCLSILGSGITPYTSLDSRSGVSLTSNGQMMFIGSSDNSGPLGLVFQHVCGNGYCRADITATRYGISGNDLSLNVDSTNPDTGGGMTIKYRGNVGIGTGSPNSRLHILTSGTSNYNAGANRGILVTSDAGARVILENPSATVCNNHRVWTMKNDNGRLSFGLLTDSGAAWVNENILTMVCEGNVGINTISPGSTLHVQGTCTTGADFGAELRVWENTFGAQMQGSTVGNTYAFFGNFRYNFNTETCSRTNYYQAGHGLLFKDGVHIFSSQPGGTTGCIFTPSERFTINNSGNVGVGCTSPGSKLTVGGTLTTTDTITTTSGTVNTIISWNASVGILGTDTNHGLQIRTCGTERIRITCNGEVGINTSTPGSYKLNVNGAFYAAGSSKEYKTSICEYNTDSCMFMKLKPVTYDYKEEWKHLGKELKSGTQIGLIAEETAEVFPELAILKDEENEKVVRNVDYEKLSIVLLAEVQKLRKEVDDLKTK